MWFPLVIEESSSYEELRSWRDESETLTFSQALSVSCRS